MYIAAFVYLFIEFLLRPYYVSSAILTLKIHQSIAQNPCPYGFIYFFIKKNINKQMKNIQVVTCVRSEIGQSDFFFFLPFLGGSQSTYGL